jgi:hypothetical protein
MMHLNIVFQFEIEQLRDDAKRAQVILEMAIRSGKQDWAIPLLQEQLKVSEELLAFALKDESIHAV